MEKLKKHFATHGPTYVLAGFSIAMAVAVTTFQKNRNNIYGTYMAERTALDKTTSAAYINLMAAKTAKANSLTSTTA